ncbi:MAG: cbb3-type cytochrome c oxidase subunit I [Thermoproteota archaeon]|nr:cbb3-type cytochrome c oxidase subunit I [Thermoproteota archaeon]
MSNNINYSPISKPFIITAVILAFIGSSIGSLWMMSFFGIALPQAFHNSFQLHKTLQIDGFLTLLIMGIGYMIIPRFRNIPLASTNLAYLSFLLVLCSIIIYTIHQVLPTINNNDDDDDNNNNIIKWSSNLLRLLGITVFAIIIFLTLKVKPKLLRLSDYFIALSIITLIIINLIQSIGYDEYNINSLTHIQLWLLFPILMIYGIEYKTLPSFLGFIRPRRILGFVSFGLVSASILFGLLSTLLYEESNLFSIIFNIVFLSSALTFGGAVYITGGFDNSSEIRRLIQGEKKARYNFIAIHIKLSFLFLYIGITMAFLFNLFHEVFAFYDLAIHITAIGFLGTTIALFLPLMIPPVIGRTINFTNFNKIPLFLIVLSLSIRAIGDFVMAQSSPPSLVPFQLYKSIIILHFFGLSGWFIVAAMLIFVIMIHRSLSESNVSKIVGR